MASLTNAIPEKTIERLSEYRRTLLASHKQGITHIFSHVLAGIHGITAVQVRRDLMLIGFSSDTKKGYDVQVLIEYISRILDSPSQMNIAVLGMSFAEVEKRGIMMPILEVQSKYHRPAYYDELLTVRIMLKELPTARINFFYEIYNEKGDLLNTGMTQLGFIHSDTRRPCRVPDWFLQLVTNKWTEE